MTPVNRCDGCAHYRPIRDLNDRGVPVGECHQAPPAFRGSPHTGNAFLGVWVHVRAHWECGQFQPADGPQPAAPTDEDDREDAPGDESPAPNASSPENASAPNASSPENASPAAVPAQKHGSAPAPLKARKRIEGNRR